MKDLGQEERMKHTTARLSVKQRPAVYLYGAALALMIGAVMALDRQPIDEADVRPAHAVVNPEKSLIEAVTRAGQRLVAVGERGLVLFSDDEGKNWRQAMVPASVTLTAVTFPTPKQGWAVGHFGLVLHSDDGGETWQTQLNGMKAAKLVLAEAEAKAKRVAADDPAMACELRNAQRLVEDGPDKPFLDLLFFDAKQGIVIGAYNLIFATDDGGATWGSLGRRVPNPGARHLYAIRAAGGSLYIAGETGLMIRSDDGGASFKRLGTPYDGSYFTLAARGDEVVVGGMRGNTYRSSDKGETWHKIELPVPASLTSSLLVDDGSAQGRLLLANQAGQILVSGDMGRSIAVLPLAPLPPITALSCLDDGKLVVATLMGIVIPDVDQACATAH
jgi:photosystem II stability/assembly factor-like uncharacterized protein